MFLVAERKNQIPALLERLGMTVYGLSKKTQLPFHQVQRIANSPTIPDGVEYKTLRILADALEASLDDLEKEE